MKIKISFSWFFTMGILLSTGCKDVSRGATSDLPPYRLQLNMFAQDKGKAQGRSEFFSDKRVMRPLVENTVPIEAPDDPNGPLYNNGVAPTYTEDGVKKDSPKDNPAHVQKNPLPVDMNLLKRGQERFGIYCTPCHGMTGYGDGTVPMKAIKGGTNLNVASLHTEVLRKVADGHLYNVITYGFSRMPAYGKQIAVEDRWAIVSYIRALQLSQNGSMSDVPMEKRSELK